jgi:hypothetical protein
MVTKSTGRRGRAAALAAAALLGLAACSPATVTALAAGRERLCSPVADSALAIIKRKVAEVEEGKKAPPAKVIP